MTRAIEQSLCAQMQSAQELERTAREAQAALPVRVFALGGAR